MTLMFAKARELMEQDYKNSDEFKEQRNVTPLSSQVKKSKFTRQGKKPFKKK
ncbi:hypothetical protein [Thalassobacillus sp. CUG 92003]|uniref:hypothetical protein n=1 Tax=Thalassobacillus sp. CUG 92003 TaxID=2736641 RepID=UPI0015E6D511|nr:hypothetical protein [Thalassobacillus sp. CUG 92003]